MVKAMNSFHFPVARGPWQCKEQKVQAVGCCPALPCPACCPLCLPHSPHKTGICTHTFCPWVAAQAHPSDWGHWICSCSPGPVLAARKEMTLSDLGNTKLPQKSQISKAQAQGSVSPAGFPSLPLPRCFAGSCRWGRHLLHTPRSFPAIFYTIILAEKLIWPMQALEKPCDISQPR